MVWRNIAKVILHHALEDSLVKCAVVGCFAQQASGVLARGPYISALGHERRRMCSISATCVPEACRESWLHHDEAGEQARVEYRCSDQSVAAPGLAYPYNR